VLDIPTARKLIADSRPERLPDGYPPGVRARVTALAQRMHADGECYSAIGRKLGLHRSTVARWLTEPLDTEAGFVSVSVTDGEDCSGELRVVSPTGYRLEGVSLDEAITALSRLS